MPCSYSRVLLLLDSHAVLALLLRKCTKRAFFFFAAVDQIFECFAMFSWRFCYHFLLCPLYLIKILLPKLSYLLHNLSIVILGKFKKKMILVILNCSLSLWPVSQSKLDFVHLYLASILAMSTNIINSTCFWPIK